MSTSIQKRPNFIVRFYYSLGIVKAFQKLVSNPKQPEHGASYSSPYGVKQPFSPAVSMSAFAGHAYTHACATRASQDLAELPIKLIRGEGENSERIEDHPFLELMNHPNTNTDGFLFREQLLIDLILSGNCYVLLVGNLRNLTSLFRLHPDNVEVITMPNRGITGYKYTDGGSSVEYPAERVLHCRNASWKSGAGGELYGTGAVESLAREIDADINAQRLASETSKQGRPDILLSPKDDADIWGRERRREILDSYRRMTDRGGAMVLSGQVDVKPLNLSPREMEFEAARKMARENISAVIGVPGTILGLPDANFATARQANLTYWQIQTKRGKKMEILFTQIAKLYDDRLRVMFDYSHVEALQDVRSEKLARIEKHIIIGGMSPGEAYAYEGLDDSPLKTQSRVEEVEEQEEEKRDFDNVLRLLAGETEKKNCEIKTRGSVGDKDPTNFPDDKDNQEVALRNSEFDRFPWEEAQALKKDYPQIWRRGGNILGNKQFNRLLPIAKRNSSIAQTRTEEEAIRLREAWAARHLKDFRLAGVVAQIKWLVVGSRGLSHMRKVISEEKQRLNKKAFITEDKKTDHWNNWVERILDPAEARFERVSAAYLQAAKKRMLQRANSVIDEVRAYEAEVQKSVHCVKAISWAELFAKAMEIKFIKNTIGRLMNDTWVVTANDQINDIYGLLDMPVPDDSRFGDRDLEQANKAIDKMANEIVDTSIKNARETVRNGIREGLSNKEIADELESLWVFDRPRARMIAQTESTLVINQATNQAYQKIDDEEDDLEVRKVWISSRDDRVRETHQDLNNSQKYGQIGIPVNDYFKIGSDRALAPAGFSDPSHSINCRCTIAPIIIEKTN
jgi:HK97 family phage portal protein